MCSYFVVLLVLCVVEWLYLDWVVCVLQLLFVNFIYVEWIMLYDNLFFCDFVVFLCVELDWVGLDVLEQVWDFFVCVVVFEWVFFDVVYIG